MTTVRLEPLRGVYHWITVLLSNCIRKICKKKPMKVLQSQMTGRVQQPGKFTLSTDKKTKFPKNEDLPKDRVEKMTTL